MGRALTRGFFVALIAAFLAWPNGQVGAGYNPDWNRKKWFLTFETTADTAGVGISLPLNGEGAPTGTTPDVSGVVPYTSSSAYMTGQCATSVAPGAGTSWTMQLDGACPNTCGGNPTGCAITDTNTTCTINTTGCSLTAGSVCRFTAVPTGSPANGRIKCSMQITF